MAKNFFITNAVAISLATAFETAANAGTAAIIEIYNGTAPADADAAESNTLLAELLCNASIFASIVDDTPGALATFNAITADSSANASGTATHFRIKTQSGGTVIAQGTVGVGTFDLALNTDAITSGSTVSISSATILVPEGP